MTLWIIGIAVWAIIGTINVGLLIAAAHRNKYGSPQSLWYMAPVAFLAPHSGFFTVMIYGYHGLMFRNPNKQPASLLDEQEWRQSA